MTTAEADRRSAMTEGDSSPTPADRALLFVRALRRRWALALAVLLVVLGTALIFVTVADRKYEAVAKVLLSESPDINALLNPAGSPSSSDREREVNTSIEFMRLAPVAQRVRRKVGLEESASALLERVEPEIEGDSNVGSIRVSGSDPREVARIANAFALEYVRVRRASARGNIDQAIALARERLASIPRERRSSGEGNELEERIRELTVASSLQTGGVSIIERATVPDAPVAPTPLLTIVVALLVGLLLALASVQVAELLDRRLLDEEAAEVALGVPVLSVIGVAADRHQRAPPTRHDGYLELAGALRLLRPNTDSAAQVVLLTPVGPDEGTSDVLTELGLALAALGRRVVAIETDLGGSVDQRLERSSPGLASVLLASSTLEDELVNVRVPATADGRSNTKPGSLQVLPSGRVPASAGALVASPAMSAVVEEVRDHADVVLVGVPSLFVQGGAGTLERLAGDVLIVVRLGHTRRDLTARAVQMLRSVAAPIAGAVVLGSPETLPAKGMGKAEASDQAGGRAGEGSLVEQGESV